MDIIQYYNNFIQGYNAEQKDIIWKQQSQIFRDFWNNRILNQRINELDDVEIDDIVKILDKKGKGNTKNDEAIAIVMIPQGVWRRMFNEIHVTKELSDLINRIFIEQDIELKANYIDKLYELNKERKNSLTGQSGNAINCLLAAYDPFNNLSMVSLNDRAKLMQFLNIEITNWSDLSIGHKITQSNYLIIKFFKENNINVSARIISEFLYFQEFRDLWKGTIYDPIEEPEETLNSNQPGFIANSLTESGYIFGLEKHLEDFLIENWEKTELGKKYELIKENGELISQQYRTSIGIIDILAREKDSNRYVVIELKKNQTSDDTVGQLARYMGWIETEKSNGVPAKGIIIAGKYDEKLHYAVKKLSDVEVFIYKVDFRLEKHEMH